MKERQRFRPDQRVRKQGSFKDLVEKGKFARGRFFYAWVAAKPERKGEAAGSRPAIGIVVNRKTNPRATGRNSVKRQVREIFRLRQGELKKGIAILVKAKEGSEAPDFHEAEADLMELFKKTGALQ